LCLVSAAIKENKRKNPIKAGDAIKNSNPSFGVEEKCAVATEIQNRQNAKSTPGIP